MSNIDKQALRNLALRATPGPWAMEHENIWYYENGFTKHLAYFCQGDDVDDSQNDVNTRYIAAAAPSTVLALLDELEAAEKRIANNERVMRAVVEAASIRGIRPFEGIECDPPTLEENAEACGDAMSARIRELEANPPKPHHNGLMQISNELVQARQRIAELEARSVSIPEVRITVSESKLKNLTWRELGAYNEGAEVAKEAIIKAIRSAGIGVKGE